MNREKKRTFFVALAGILALFLFVAVLGFIRGDTYMEELVHGTKKTAITAFRILGLDGKRKDPRLLAENEELKDTTATVPILRVGEEVVFYPEFAFYVLSSKKEYETKIGSWIWKVSGGGNSISTLLKDDIIKEIIQLKVVAREAAINNIYVEEKERKELTASATEQLALIDPQLSAKYYLDVELLAGIYEENFLASKFFHKITGDIEGEFRGGTETEAFRAAYGEWEKKVEVEIYKKNLERLEISEKGIEMKGGLLKSVP